MSEAISQEHIGHELQKAVRRLKAMESALGTLAAVLATVVRATGANTTEGRQARRAETQVRHMLEQLRAIDDEVDDA